MKSTTDIWFASYLIDLHGIKLEDFKITSRGRGIFFFNISDDEWKNHKLQFVKSDISKVKHGQEKLKDLLY